MKHFMGIDAGTSGIKVLIFDELGQVCGFGYRECDVITPQPGWVEQEPESLWQACDLAVRQAIASCKTNLQLEGIGFSGQMQGCLLIDRDKKPIGNCIIWLDQRAEAEVEDICAIISDEAALELTCNQCLNSFWAPKLLWLRKNRPEDYARAYKVLFVKDYLRMKMTGEIAAELSDASLSFFVDVKNRRWNREVFERLDIDMGIVPETLLESWQPAGKLAKSVAESWGVSEGIAVIAGAGDQPAGGVGSGIIQPGILGSAIGTSGVVFGCTASPLMDREKRAVTTMVHAVENKWCFLGLVLSAGGSFKWMRDTFFQAEKLHCQQNGSDVYDLMTARAAQVAPGSEGLIFLPYLNGEKTPISDKDARAVFLGMSYRHGLNEMCRAAMEGITYAMRDSVEICRSMGHEVNEIRASGGGAKSPLWLQMQADIYNAHVVTMNVDESPAAGAAILAAIGSGHFGSVEQACNAWLKPLRHFEPKPENAAIYNDYYQEYKALYPALKASFSRQAQRVQKNADIL